MLPYIWGLPSANQICLCRCAS